MEENTKILNRVMLIMNYDSSKTLNENTTELGIIEQAGAVKDIEKALVGLKGAERAALRDILYKDAKNIVRSDGSAFKSVTELESALKNGELAPSVLGRLRSQLLRNPSIGAELKTFLIQDLTKNPRFISKYKNASQEEIIAGLQKAKPPYTPEQAQEIAGAFEKQRKGITTEPIASPPKGEIPPASDASINKTTTTQANPTTITNTGSGNITSSVDNSVHNTIVYQINDFKGATVTGNVNIKGVEKAAAEAREVPVTALKDGSEVIVATEKGAVDATKETLVQRGMKAVKTFVISKAILTGLIAAGTIGALYFLLRKKHGTNVAIVDEDGVNQDLGDNQDSGIPVPPPPASVTPPIDTTPPERVTPITPINTSKLSLSNIANTIEPNKLASSPVGNQMSPERSSELINNIKRNKKYVGPALNPQEKTFVDQYMAKSGFGSPTTEKIRYKDGIPSSEKIKYKA